MEKKGPQQDPDTGQSKTGGKDERRQRSWNRSRVVEQDGRGATGPDLRGSNGESERGKEKWAVKPRPRGERGARGGARGQSRERGGDSRRQGGEATPRGRGWGWGRHREGAGQRETEVTMERRGRGDPKYDVNRNPQTSASTAASQGRERTTQHPGIGYKKLEELSKQNPSIVAISLSNHPALEEFLKQTRMSKELIELLCLVLSNAFRSRADRATLQHLANIVKGSDFFRVVLPYYLTDMESERNGVRRVQYPEHLGNILVILSEVLSMYPASSLQVVRLVLTQLQASTHSLKASGVQINLQVEESVENLQVLLRHLQERSREGTLRSDRDTYALLQNIGPEPEDQQNFRTIPIYPTSEEFHKEQRPFLRPNLTSQRYTNTHIYLDTHFRLLREDFVRPLRDGIQQILTSQMNVGMRDQPLRTKRFDDIRVYFNTQVAFPTCTNTGIAFIIKFDLQPLRFVQWENSKRLIYGSLLCLSCDNFETFMYATVSDRDPKQLRKGLVQVKFTEESRLMLTGFQKDQSFLMVETTAYFEAYRYVLRGLQDLEEDNLPFQRYIVECNGDVQPPAYLERGDTYDLSCIADPQHKHSLPPFHSLRKEAWPRKERLGLDDSQMEAFQLALTKELAIIQGPPGTGKTYVGLKIAQALLSNQALWKEDKAPMLVVCYTNHALDQFLEGIHRFLTNDIVRVGGRSNSEILKQFNLRKLTSSPGFKRLLPSHLRHAHNDVYRELCEAEQVLQHHSKMLECSLKGVLRKNILWAFILPTHRNDLCHPPGIKKWGQKKKSDDIMEWLGVGSTSVLKRETENEHENEDMEAVEALEVEQDDLIDIAEEADLIQEERIIDDSDPREAQVSRKNKDDVRMLEEMMLGMNLEKNEIEPEESNEEWEIQKHQKQKIRNRIRQQLRKTSVMTPEEEKAVMDIWSLGLPDRWKLYRLWMTRCKEKAHTTIFESEQEYQNTAERLADVKFQEDLVLLREAKVIGMTTTGAAKFRNILQEVKPPVVIVEEAAEVLEAHTITTLSDACKHLILIGDHQQLRPSATVYDLAKNFDLEMSMFERLVKMGLPYVRLNYQHRMRPEIASLLSPHIYSELENHPSVFEYDNIKGLNTNVFFVEHNHREEEIKDGKSHQNKHEAQFVVALCHYLLLQDYEPDQITILTTYTGQLHCLHKLMPANKFRGVKVHVVDKYQGEENDIVLLSLVRSNPQGKVGFLNIPNRVCVALSRAKKGLFCIGDRTMLQQVQLWSNIFHTLSEKNQIGNALTLCCQNHPNRQVPASCAEDFEQAPEGGCMEPCEFRLDCGHVCASVCHPYDPEHKKYKCAKKCQKILCDLGHKCPLVCHRPCPEKCQVRLEKIIPQCQHKQTVPCHQEPNEFKCQEPCQKLLVCGHPCDSLCGEECTRECKVEISLKLGCGHTQQAACFQRWREEGPLCHSPCEEELKCGHKCPGKCGMCYQGRFHMPHQCERLLICSHKCNEPCNRSCPPCQQRCQNRCIHSKCMLPCGQACVPCHEPCTWQCPHQSCTKLCHEPCDRPPCTRPCGKRLPCCHQCIGLCGDPCPTKCRVCNRVEVTEVFFGNEDDPEASFIQLEDCGHIIEHSAMDIYMEMDDSSQMNEGEQVAIKLKECPKCRTPIRKNRRYGAQINRCLAEIETVKRKINGNLQDIEEQRTALQLQWNENLASIGLDMQERYFQIGDQLGKKYLTKNDLWSLENKMNFQIRITKLMKIQTGATLPGQTFTSKAFQQFQCWLNGKHPRFTDQQVFDLKRELQRLTFLTELNARCHKADKRGERERIQAEEKTLRELLEKNSQFTELDERRVEDGMKELDTLLPPSGLNITEEERKMIVSSMNMAPGHWYKCPNGHIYVITECGGAMEQRKCPDCSATIGGQSHRLESGNTVATEMDGSQHPAWSETNNLLNYNQFNL